MERVIRKLTTTDVESYLDVYLNAYPAYKDLDDECREKYRKKATREITENKEVIHWGMIEKSAGCEKVIAIMKVVHFNMNMFGKMQPAYGLMALGVHPLYKKQGVALAMIREFEKIAYDDGVTVTMLLPFNIPFYKRMGYGFGGLLNEYHIPTSGLPKFDDGKADSGDACRGGSGNEHLRFLTLEDLPEVLACHKRFVRANHGMVDRFEEEIRGMEDDSQVFRVGYEEGGRLRGYIAWRYVPASDVNYTQVTMSVEEMIYENGQILRAMLGFMRNQADLCQTVVIRTGEPDFIHLLDDPQDVSKNYIDFGFLQTNVSAVGTMYKIINPEKFVADTAHREFLAAAGHEFTARFCYEKELEHEEASVTITFADAGWDIVADDAKPDMTITLRQGAFASVMMGSADISAMVRLGAAEIDHPECLGELESLLACSQKPWCNSDY